MESPVIFFTNKFAELSFLPQQKIAICKANYAFIPQNEFKAIFEKATEMIKENYLKKFIFDKRALVTFHQPSMEWYHLVWKKDVLGYGLKVHRKILPDDFVFRKSVEIGKQKIMKENPDNILSQVDIQYFDTLEECIEK